MPQSLTRLPIASLSVYPSYQDDSASESAEDEYRRFRAPLLLLLDGHRGSITRLSIFSSALWDCPIHILQDLEELWIYTARDLSNATLLFHHCARLKSLSVHTSYEVPVLDIVAEFIDVLAAHPTGLPGLTHFKLRTAEVSREQFEHLARFVGEKKKLRCLDCCSLCHSTEEMWPLLSALRSLPCLEVLGLDLPFIAVTTEYYQVLRRMFPEGITALRLNFEYDDYADDVPADYSLARISSHYPTLKADVICIVDKPTETSLRSHR